MKIIKHIKRSFFWADKPAGSLVVVLNIVSCTLFAIFLTGCDTKTETADTDKTSGQVVQSSDEQQSGQSPTQSFAVHPGQKLHDANCISCHDSAIYTREERKARDFMQLAATVKRCNANLEPRLSMGEIEQVTEYLNQTYYQYEK